MRPLSLRASLTAWFVGLTMLLLAAFSATLHSRLSRALHDGLDARLRARAETMVGNCEWDEDAGGVEFKLAQELGAEASTDPAGLGFEVWHWPKRRPVARSGEPISIEAPEAGFDPGPLPALALATFEREGPRRLCTLFANVPPTPPDEDGESKPEFDVLVRVTESLAPVEAQLARVAWQLVVLVGASLLVVLGLGLFLSRRFARPLQVLGEAAAAVRSGERRPMPRRGSGDEIDRLAEVLDRSFTSLEQSLARQARFTADAAHELRNPISVIRNAAEVALRHERTGEQYREFLSDVLSTSVRMGKIVEALLLLARTDAGVIRSTFRDVDLVAVARESAAARAEGSDRIRVSDGSPAVIRGEPGLLRVLADNLLANALRYSDGKPVDVAVTTAGDSRVCFSVRDFGRGVPAAARKLVFERFYRVESAPSDPSGAGLGLAIVAEVARVHSADCSLEDASPGTRVTVRFPPAGADLAKG
jgi:signal transduction histidine kinase